MNEICFDLAGSTFSGQISSLSFEDFFTGADGLNPFAHDFHWVHNITSLPQVFMVGAPSASTPQYGKNDARHKLRWMVRDVIRAALRGILSGESRNG